MLWTATTNHLPPTLPPDLCHTEAAPSTLYNCKTTLQLLITHLPFPSGGWAYQILAKLAAQQHWSKEVPARFPLACSALQLPICYPNSTVTPRIVKSYTHRMLELDNGYHWFMPLEQSLRQEFVFKRFIQELISEKDGEGSRIEQGENTKQGYRLC